MGKDKLIELLCQYFCVGGDCYSFNLTRDKSAFAIGTMSFDDFEEFDDESMNDLADFLIKNGVSVK